MCGFWYWLIYQHFELEEAVVVRRWNCVKLGTRKHRAANPLIYSNGKHIRRAKRWHWLVKGGVSGHSNAFDYPVVDHWGRANEYGSWNRVHYVYGFVRSTIFMCAALGRGERVEHGQPAPFSLTRNGAAAVNMSVMAHRLTVPARTQSNGG